MEGISVHSEVNINETFASNQWWNPAQREEDDIAAAVISFLYGGRAEDPDYGIINKPVILRTGGKKGLRPCTGKLRIRKMYKFLVLGGGKLTKK